MTFVYYFQATLGVLFGIAGFAGVCILVAYTVNEFSYYYAVLRAWLTNIRYRGKSNVGEIKKP